MAAVTQLSNLCFSNGSMETPTRSNQPSMASSLLVARTIRRKAFPGYGIIGKWKPLHCRPMSTGRTAAQATLPSSSPTYPWLMLPPVLESDSTTAAYKFYSLGEKRVVTLTCEGAAREVTASGDVMFFTGSSHGWVGLWNPHTHDLFLYNPISRRHIKLPPFHDLPYYNHDPVWDAFRVEKIILSSSPDDEACRAVIIYKLDGMMAFCCPARPNDKWAPMGDPWGPDDGMNPAGSYCDCVYSPGHGLFFALTQHNTLECWDLQEPCSPASTRVTNDLNLRGSPQWEPKPTTRLVVMGWDILFVTPHTTELLDLDGLCGVDTRDYGLTYYKPLPYWVTIDFDVDRYDPEGGDLVRCSSLGNWALFVGACSHAVALSAAQMPGLRPNSIYFTDMEGTEVFKNDQVINGNDIGILDYEKKTVSPCYYPVDVRRLKKIFPAPMWFFPSLASN
ncbi:hypothetical protein STAS_29396 [Striga asiatica]|uniref:KIB1-4 beta-propeller domain-containing protein n=1 Tax=Striga asiatica TaxID=4170 RepID=A0A5A7R3E3_STRAF|nr:hypothetical protein STAS_29396 [Striga asiatica]